MNRIVLLGPPACGKGTQCRNIVNLLGLTTLGTGAMLRREVESGSDLGTDLDKYLSAGNYVPDELIMTMVNNWLTAQNGNGWLLDGFPRTLAQAESLEANPTTQPTLAIGLDVPEFELEQRIANRRECASCDSTWTVSPGQSSECPSCGGELRSRSDDALDSFRVRYANYKEHTQPLFDYYAAKGKLLFINGSNSPEDVFASIKKFLTQ